MTQSRALSSVLLYCLSTVRNLSLTLGPLQIRGTFYVYYKFLFFSLQMETNGHLAHSGFLAWQRYLPKKIIW